jgi:hypothetical protein
VSTEFEKLPTDGREIKLTVSSLIFEGGVPESFMDNVEFMAAGDDTDDDFAEDEGPQTLEQVTVAAYAEENGRVTVTYDDSEILDIESLGQSFIEELAKASGDALDTSAILPDADEIEIIEFETEFDYLTEDDPSHITQV